MSEDPPTYGGFRETRLASHDRRAIASAFGDALLDLTGKVYEVEILTLEPQPDDQADIRLWAQRVDDSEIPDAERISGRTAE